ncbi:MAG: hypothetical protein LBT33_09305 [Spirochaetia bacterium]|jgi:hypothetical protein|nr:hypothetical protein [Spirochaetia bacterium]
MGALKTGFEYPADLFSVLKKHLALKKSALLLPENGTDVFVPWSITGFDKTTQRRMRIAPDLVYNALRYGESKIILTNLKEMEGLAPCFSSREAALAECLLLCFFTFEEKVTGVLIVADSPYLLLGASVLRLFFAVVTALASPVLARSRGARLRKRRDHGLLRKDRFLAALKKHAEDLPEGSALTLFTLDVKALVKQILESNPDIDSYRVLQDISSVIETLLAGCPVFVSSAKKKVLAATQAGKYDSALFIHQVSLRLRKLFQTAGGGKKPGADLREDGIVITENSLPGGEIPDDVIARFL